MRFLPLTFAMIVAAALFTAPNAFAFTLDDNSTKADGSPRYVDPDEQPLPWVSGGSSNQANEYNSDPATSTTNPAAGLNGNNYGAPVWGSPTFSGRHWR